MTGPLQRASTAAVAAVTLLVTAAPAGPAAAVGDGGATSRVTRDGRIITTILGDARPGGPRRGDTTVTWLTLTDAELAFAFQVAAARPDLDSPFLRTLAPLWQGGLAPDLDVQVELRGGTPTGAVRVVPGAGGPGRALARQMVTVLPELPVRISPPAGGAVPIGQPVFFSFDPAAFATVVDRSLTAGGLTARVRARAVGFQVRSGDPAAVGAVVSCAGPGRPYDPEAPASPVRQARAADACTVTYRTATGVAGRRDAWYGDVTVLWRAEWTLDGTTWTPLGDIGRLTLFRREVRPAETAIERIPDRRRG